MGRNREHIKPGTRFKKWTVLGLADAKPYENTKYVCQCDCGAHHEVAGFTLKNGRSTQCNHCATKNWRRLCKKCGDELDQGK